MEPTNTTATETVKVEFMSIFSKLRGCLTNEELGVAAMSGNVWSEYELGKLLRVAMDVLESAPAGEMTEITKAFAIGKIGRLAAKYGVPVEVMRTAVKSNDNFEIIKGSDSGTEYIRLASKLR